MKMQKAVILLGFLPNPRFMKRIEVEKQLYNLHVICWDRGIDMMPSTKGVGYEITVHHVDAVSDPLKRLIPYQKFTKLALNQLISIEPNLIHVQGLDMLRIANKYKQKYNQNVRIVYEIADLHRLIIDKQNNLVKRFAHNLLVHEEKKLSHQYDLLILTSEKFYEEFYSAFIDREKVLIMPNVPDLSVFEGYTKKVKGDPMIIGYIGGVRYKQQMQNLIDASKEVNMKLMIAGFEQEPKTIEQQCQDNESIEWIGPYDFETQVCDLYQKCDLMYVVYNADLKNERIALPNKLYESVYCEIPLIVAKGTYLSDVVQEWNVGVSVDHNSVDSLVSILKELRDNSALYDTLVDSCKANVEKIDLNRYNNKLIERLMKISA